jgi:cytoskeletal protein CcmA (bactofilin family)
MFGKNSKPRNSAMKNDMPGQPNINIVSAGSVFTGTLKSKSDLRVSGTIDGEIQAESKCIVAESGLVKGDLITKEADIAGTVQGELKVSNRLILRASAKIIGDIQTKVLMVEEGAHIDGSCKMGDQVAAAPGASGAGNNLKKELEKKSP